MKIPRDAGELRIHASGTGRSYPVHEANGFADDLHKVIEHGGGTARLRTDGPQSVITSRQLVERDTNILKALDHARREGFTVSVTGAVCLLTVLVTLKTRCAARKDS